MDPRLPILQRRQEIEDAIGRYQVVVLCGETGSGKTTQLPQICLAMERGKSGMIGHTQPRRLAARAVAARIAEEMNVRLGGPVGVKVRFQDQTSRETRIKLLTDGMLLAELTGDPELRAYDTIIIDEAHERSLNIDFLMGVFRALLPRRSDLKLIITSATIDPRRFSDYFGGPAKAPVIEVSGRMFPVELRYRPTGDDEEDFERIEVNSVVDAVTELTSPRLPHGDVLVFLPGEREIRMVADALRREQAAAEILPLFARLTNQEQDRIFHPAQGGARRVILSTNIAETSLTVPGIRYVVDTGYARISRYDPQRKVQRLPVEPISRASANQRSGRCGRVAEGVCIRLFSEASFAARPVFTEPEIRRSSLAGVILQMKSLGLGDIEAFPFLDPPDAASIKDGYETLFELGAIDTASSAGRLTDIGRAISRLPVEPRVGRMLLAAEREGALNEVLVLAAALSIQDPRERPMGRADDADRAQLVFRHETSDFVTLLRLWEQYEHASREFSSGALFGWCRDHFVSAARMREWGETHRQLRTLAEELELRRNSRPASEDAVHRSLLTGLISNVACREGAAGSFDYRGVRGNVVSLFPGSVLFKKSPQWIMAAEVVQTTRLYARTIARVDPAWIEELAGHMFQRQLSDKHLDAETGEPSAWERVSMSGIVVVPRRRTAIAAVDPGAARELFIRDGLALCKWRSEAPFMVHNRRIREQAQQAEAKLRRRDVLAGEEQIAAWFEQRIPKAVCDPAGFEAWRIAAEKAQPDLLKLPLEAVLRPQSVSALDPAQYPDRIELSAGGAVLSYALAPGQEHDGITATVALTSLLALKTERTQWLVPGFLPELVHSLFKTQPKSIRAALETKGSLSDLAAQTAELLEFARGSLADKLSEALEVLHGLKVDPGAWSFTGLPDHLRMRVVVVDHIGHELGAERDLDELKSRFEARIKKARAAEARARYQRIGLTSWDFDELPEDVASEVPGTSAVMHPALIDDGATVSLSLMDSAALAAAHTHRGIRRLFALAVRDEVEHHINALPLWPEMVRHYAALGSNEQLRDGLTCLIAERTFLASPHLVRTREAFLERQQECWGQLARAAREVGDVVARLLEPRYRVAHRISSGTPRLWAASIADIREHAAYLMPRGFLLLVPWERLRNYPRYADAMRARLFKLREDGSGAETQLLTTFAPYWKRFTGWIATSMSAEREAATESGAQPDATGAKPRLAKAPLPQARRVAQSINLEAGEWWVQPGNLNATMQRYRWALEDARVALFAPELAGGIPMKMADLDALWAQAVADK